MDDNTTPSQPATWTTISNSPDYQALGPDDQEALRNSYYTKVVAPAKPQGVDDNSWKKQFVSQSIGTDMKSGAIESTEDSLDRLKRNGFDVNQEDDREVSTGAGIAAGLTKSAAGLGQLGTSAIGEVGKGLSAVGATDIGGDIQQSAQNVHGQLAQVPAQMNAYEASQASPGAANVGDVIGQTAPYLAAPESTGIGAIDASIAKALPTLSGATAAAKGLTDEAVTGGEKLVGAIGKGVSQAPGIATTAAATNVNNASTPSGDLNSRINEFENAGKIAVAAGTAIPLAASGTKMLADLSKLGYNTVSSFFSPETRQALAEQTAGKQIINAAGGDQDAVLTKLDTATGKYQGTNVNPTTTQVLPETQDIANIQNKTTQNSINAAQTQAKTALAEHASNLINPEQAKAGEQAINEASQALTDKEEGAKQAQQQQGAEFTNEARDNSPGSIAAKGSENVLGAEQNAIAEKNKNYDIQKKAEASVPVQSEDLANSLKASGVEGSPYFDSAMEKLKQSNGGVNPLDELNVFHVGTDPTSKKVMFYGDKTQSSLSSLSTATDAVDTLLADRTVKLTPQEKTAMTQLGGALNDYKQKIIDGLPEDQQKALSAGDTNFAANSIPLRQQNVARNTEAEAGIQNPEQSLAREQNEGQAVKTTSGPLSRETANSKIFNDTLNGSLSNQTKAYEAVGIKPGEQAGQSVEDLVRAEPTQSKTIADYIKSNIQSDAVGKDGTVDWDKAETLLNDPKSGWKSAIDKLNPEDQKSLKDWYNGESEFAAKSKDMQVQAAMENKPFLDLKGKLEGNRAATADEITSNPEATDKFLSLGKDLSPEGQEAQRQWGLKMLLRPDGNVIKLTKDGNQEISQEWINKVRSSVATGDETPERQVLEKLEGKNVDDIDKILDMGHELGYTKPKNSEDELGVGDLAEGAGYVAGLRYGTIGKAKRVAAELINRNYTPTLEKALTDPAYARELVEKYQASDWTSVAKLMQDAGATKLAGADIGESDNAKQAPQAAPKSNLPTNLPLNVNPNLSAEPLGKSTDPETRTIETSEPMAYTTSGSVSTRELEEYESEYNLPKGVLSAVMNKESRGNPDAVNNNTATGKPSIGAFQFQPGTAKQYGIDPKDPHQSAEGAAAYLSDLKDEFGSMEKALAAYNWGPGNLKRQGYSKAPPETRDYVKTIMAQL